MNDRTFLFISQVLTIIGLVACGIWCSYLSEWQDDLGTRENQVYGATVDAMSLQDAFGGVMSKKRSAFVSWDAVTIRRGWTGEKVRIPAGSQVFVEVLVDDDQGKTYLTQPIGFLTPDGKEIYGTTGDGIEFPPYATDGELSPPEGEATK